MGAKHAQNLNFYVEILKTLQKRESLGVDCSVKGGHWMQDLCKKGRLLTGR